MWECNFTLFTQAVHQETIRHNVPESIALHFDLIFTTVCFPVQGGRSTVDGQQLISVSKIEDR